MGGEQLWGFERKGRKGRKEVGGTEGREGRKTDVKEGRKEVGE